MEADGKGMTVALQFTLRLPGVLADETRPVRVSLVLGSDG